MRKKIKIAWFVTPLNFSTKFGGIWRRLRNWAGNFDKEEFDLTLILGGPNVQHASEYLNSYKEDFNNVRVIILQHVYPFSIFSIRGAVKLAHILKKLDVDIIHTLFIQSDIIGGISRKIAQTPVHISSLEGALLPYYTHPVKRLIYKVSYAMIKKDLNAVIALCRATGNEAMKDFNLNENLIKLVYSGVDLSKFPYKNPVLLNSDEIVIGSIGYLGEGKIIKSIIEAAPKVLSEFPKSRFVVVGSGPELEKLENLAKALQVEHKVDFKGYTDDVINALHSLDIFVFTSKYEGLPWVVLEAQAAGIPTIASAVGGVPEVIKDKYNGLLWYNNNHEDLAALVIWMISNYSKAVEFAKNGRKTVENHFDILNETREIQNIYRNMLKK